MRDIAKDKAHLEIIKNKGLPWTSAHEATSYWISQYEAAQARISELESRLHPNNRPDVVTRPEHDRALETVFRELESLKE